MVIASLYDRSSTGPEEPRTGIERNRNGICLLDTGPIPHVEVWRNDLRFISCTSVWSDGPGRLRW